MLLLPLSKRVYLKSTEFAPFRGMGGGMRSRICRCLPCRVGAFLEDVPCTGNQMGCHKSCLSCKRKADIYHAYLFIPLCKTKYEVVCKYSDKHCRPWSTSLGSALFSNCGSAFLFRVIILYATSRLTGNWTDWYFFF